MRIAYGWIGWCTVGASDKIWGWLWIDPRPGEKHPPRWDPIHTFSGRRKGTILNLKRSVYGSSILEEMEARRNRGYAMIDHSDLLTIWPGFDEMIVDKLMFHVLSN